MNSQGGLPMELQSSHFLDRRRARVLAGLIGLAALMAMAQVWFIANRIDPAGNPVTGAPSALHDPAINPLFEACRTERTAEVDRMLAEGVIKTVQHAEFRERAITTCAGQFPPVPAN